MPDEVETQSSRYQSGAFHAGGVVFGIRVAEDGTKLTGTPELTCMKLGPGPGIYQVFHSWGKDELIAIPHSHGPYVRKFGLMQDDGVVMVYVYEWDSSLQVDTEFNLVLVRV
jgi:hypothetical protein